MMRALAVAVIVAIGALLSGVAVSGEASLSWTNATTRTDGSAITPAQRRGTRVEWGTCSSLTPPAFGTKSGEATAAVGASAYQVTGLAAGNDVQQMTGQRLVTGFDIDTFAGSAEAVPVTEHRWKAGQQSVGDIVLL